jgi:hypothetical protein
LPSHIIPWGSETVNRLICPGDEQRQLIPGVSPQTLFLRAEHVGEGGNAADGAPGQAGAAGGRATLGITPLGGEIFLTNETLLFEFSELSFHLVKGGTVFYRQKLSKNRAAPLHKGKEKP